MWILVVEDDELQSDDLANLLGSEFSAHAALDILVIATEREFTEWLDAPTSGVPDLVVLDVMLQWTDPTPAMPNPPSELAEATPYSAGIRCYRRLAENPATAHVPVILYTVLEESDLDLAVNELPDHVLYVQKGMGDSNFVETVRRVIAAGR